MFRHQGKTRTLSHNLKIASLFSFVAGMVNVSGFVAVQRLTTNVTGHFAFFVDEVFKLNFWQAFVFFSYTFFFFFGSFLSGLITEYMSRRSERYIFVFPILIECLLLLSVGLLMPRYIPINTEVVACCLLMAMGIQNSLVTTLSNAIIRTTHLTGLFTDLGLELSQLFFYKEAADRTKLISSIKLRFTIISFFFLGGVFCGVVYSYVQLYSLVIAGGLLIAGIIYDTVRYNILLLKRRLQQLPILKHGQD